MLLPELWDLLHCWRSHPPVHIMLLPFYRWATGTEEDSGAEQATSRRPSRMTEQDMKTMRAITGGKTKTFDQLPLAMQAKINEMKQRREESHGA